MLDAQEATEENGAMESQAYAVSTTNINPPVDLKPSLMAVNTLWATETEIAKFLLTKEGTLLEKPMDHQANVLWEPLKISDTKTEANLLCVTDIPALLMEKLSSFLQEAES